MKFEFENTLVPAEEIETIGRKLESYQKHLNEVVAAADYSSPESSINLPDDSGIRDSVTELANEKTKNGLSYLVVVGIGGSNLGTEAVSEALGGYYNKLLSNSHPSVLFLETTDSRYMESLFQILNKVNSASEILICVVSKSGTTTETVANASLLTDKLFEKFGEVAKERLVAITDPDSSLASVAREEGFSLLEIPKVVGGRYSVMSAVGLFPLACLGFDIEKLHAGAREMRDRSLSQTDNPAMHSAIMLAHHYEEGCRIHDTFIFDPSFEYLGKWYRQLLAESIGKRMDRDGNERRIGYTPTVSIGSTDLHSVGQLTLGGPRDKITTFVSRDLGSEEFDIPTSGAFSGLTQGRTLEEVLEALIRGAESAYVKSGLPFLSCTLESVDEFEIGAFMQWKMLEVMYLGELLNVNAFDQPEVESYKKATRSILENGQETQGQ
ncbi:MAG: hypothetical protein U5L75_02735 [Candidatus Campbellbacteria bacterium]|nr:hypothetical protein [Candidatus Campbellbacteria bacterium]